MHSRILTPSSRARLLTLMTAGRKICCCCLRDALLLPAGDRSSLTAAVDTAGFGLDEEDADGEATGIEDWFAFLGTAFQSLLGKSLLG